MCRSTSLPTFRVHLMLLTRKTSCVVEIRLHNHIVLQKLFFLSEEQLFISSPLKSYLCIPVYACTFVYFYQNQSISDDTTYLNMCLDVSITLSSNNYVCRFIEFFRVFPPHLYSKKLCIGKLQTYLLNQLVVDLVCS